MRCPRVNYPTLLWTELPHRSLEEYIPYVALDRYTMQKPGQICCALLWTELPCKILEKNTLYFSRQSILTTRMLLGIQCMFLWKELPCETIEGSNLCYSRLSYKAATWRNIPCVVLDEVTMKKTGGNCPTLLWTELSCRSFEVYILQCSRQSKHAVLYISLDRAAMQKPGEKYPMLLWTVLPPESQEGSGVRCSGQNYYVEI